MLELAVMGFGTVGSGVVEVFYKNRGLLEKNVGQALAIKYILDLREFPGSPYESLFTKDFQQILQDDGIKVVAEVMGGLEPAYTFTKACLERGKSVVSSNKELVAAKGGELLEIAKAHGCNYLFEASVGGGIPVLRPLHVCLAANRISEIAGILNGTTNFILTQMRKEHMPFEEALALAQHLGYAERDPSADVEGGDACRKICILADIAFGKQMNPAAVSTEGISRLTPEDVAYAADCGCALKLIGRAKRGETDAAPMLIVSPAFVRTDSQLGTTDGVFNAILIRGDAVGDVVFYGRGAGKLPTASAVVADMLECAGAEKHVESLSWSMEPGAIGDAQDEVAGMYYRCTGCTEALARKVYGDGIRILHREDCPLEEFAFAAPSMSAKNHAQACTVLERGGASILAKIRMLDY